MFASLSVAGFLLVGPCSPDKLVPAPPSAGPQDAPSAPSQGTPETRRSAPSTGPTDPASVDQTACQLEVEVTGPHGEPLAGAIIEVRNANGRGIPGMGSTLRDGRAVLHGVPCAPLFGVASWLRSDLRAKGFSVAPVRGGGAARVQVALDETCEMRVEVYSTSGSPVLGARVGLHPSSPDLVGVDSRGLAELVLCPGPFTRFFVVARGYATAVLPVPDMGPKDAPLQVRLRPAVEVEGTVEGSVMGVSSLTMAGARRCVVTGDALFACQSEGTWPLMLEVDCGDTPPIYLSIDSAEARFEADCDAPPEDPLRHHRQATLPSAAPARGEGVERAEAEMCPQVVIHPWAGRFFIRQVSMYSPAWEAGLRPGHALISVDGEAAEDRDMDSLQFDLVPSPSKQVDLGYATADGQVHRARYGCEL